MQTLVKNDRPLASLHPNFGLFDEASGFGGLRGLLPIIRRVDNLPPDSFEAANTVTDRLLDGGWKYSLGMYRLHDMLKKKAGNCLGLSCLYGALLQDRGFEPEYELVIGPKGYQSIDEQELLDHMLCGHAFPYHAPVLPERPVGGEKLLFTTLEHPRLVLDDQRFETTALSAQHPSQIKGERIRKLDYRELTGLVFYERAHAARMVGDYEQASQLLDRALQWDPQNNGIHAEKAEAALSVFDDEAFDKACQKHAESKVNDSKYWLYCYLLLGDVDGLERALVANPTDMRVWPIKHVNRERDVADMRANLAIAAQSIARSEILNLGSFYAAYAAFLAKVFPKHAVALVSKSQDRGTDAFEHHLALALLGSCKEVKWDRRDKPRDHLAKLTDKSSFLSPFQMTRVLFTANRLSACNGEWEDHQSRFGDRRTFKAAMSCMSSQWDSM
ncbi:MAG: hypothetical protein RL235_79 [Chlamydiota bacterium]|jgi:tetratricopeptide (TPR) repeat protein